MSKQNKRGRSTGSLGSFIAVERYIMQSVAFRSLSPNARSAYLEVCFGYDGKNNGRILLSSRILADRLNRDRSTAARALNELVHLGFIECRSKGSFNCKLLHSSEWRLTAHKCDVTGELPSKLFARWKPENSEHGGTGELSGGTGATDSLKTTRNYPSQWHGCNREGPFEGVSGGTGETLLYSNHTTLNPHTADSSVASAANQKASALQADTRPMFKPSELPVQGIAFDSNLDGFKPMSAIISDNGTNLGMVFALVRNSQSQTASPQNIAA